MAIYEEPNSFMTEVSVVKTLVTHHTPKVCSYML